MDDKRRMIAEAVEEICDADDRGALPADVFRQRVIDAVEAAWVDGVNLAGLTAAARVRLIVPTPPDNDNG
jgi:hypothetical protein